MSSKQPPHTPDAAPPVSAAVAILEFGRLLQQEDQRHLADRKPGLIQEAEEKLIAQLSTDKNTLLKPALNFNATKPIDPVALRILSTVAYLQLCTNRQAIAIGDVAKAVASGEPAKMLETQPTNGPTRIRHGESRRVAASHSQQCGSDWQNIWAAVTLTRLDTNSRWES